MERIAKENVEFHANEFMVANTGNPYIRGTEQWWRWLIRWFETVEVAYVCKYSDPREWRD